MYGAFLQMVKKLTKHGNSLALVIDRPILDLLKIDPTTPLEVTTDGRQLFIAPVHPDARKARFDAAQTMAHAKYAKAFRKLAE
jgi:antitoxin MazE